MGTLFIHLLINFNFRRNSSTLPENDFKCLYLATRLLTQIQKVIGMSEHFVPGVLCALSFALWNLNEIIDGRLVSVCPDEDHPTGGAVCLKGKAAPELIYSEARVLWPLRRTREKGAADPGWKRISWDKALTEIAEKLTQFKTESGAESVAFGVTTPSGTPIIDSVEWIERFVRHYGSPNTCYSTEVCNWHKDTAHTFTFWLHNAGCRLQ